MKGQKIVQVLNELPGVHCMGTSAFGGDDFDVQFGVEKSDKGWRVLSIIAAAICQFDYVQLRASYNGMPDESLKIESLAFSIEGWNGESHSSLADAIKALGTLKCPPAGPHDFRIT